MFSHDLTLNEFICSIPLCQPEADLGSILHIFHQTNCDSLAIPGKNNNWGIISSQNLLALLAESWQQFSVVMVSHPRRSPHQKNFSLDTSKDVNFLIEPAIICQGDTSLEQFLSSLGNELFHHSQDEYLIVNRLGQLKGKLDKDKLLRYLASKFNQEEIHPKLPISSLSLLSLLDNLALPLKIETVEQETCYTNQYWQELISQDRDEHLAQSEKLNVSIAHWWMETFNSLNNLKQQNQEINLEPTNQQVDLCCLKDRYYARDRSHLSSSSQAVSLTNANLKNLATPQTLVSYGDNFSVSCLIDDLHPPSVRALPMEIEIEKGLDWNYIKIPLKLDHLDNVELSTTKATVYCLVLAVKASLLQSTNNDEESSLSATNESTFERLLTTISHELKSPLTGIVGLSNLLNSQKLGHLNQRQELYVQLIHNSGQKLMNIVNNLVELTNLTTRKLELQTEEIELETLLRQLYQQVITKVQTINSTESELLISTSGLKVNIESGLEVVFSDRFRLSIILSHLMLETIYFSNSPSTALNVEVKKINGSTAIKVMNDLVNTSISTSTQIDLGTVHSNAGLNLIMAKYLAEIILGEIKSTYTANGCSSTLLLPIVNSLPNLPPPTSNRIETPHPKSQKNITILCLYPESEVIDSTTGNNNGLDFNLKKWAEQDWSDESQSPSYYQHRIIEADGLEQAHTLARIWQLDAIVLDGYQIIDPKGYLQSLKKSEYLSALPLITLDTETTEAANQIESLNVYPCLLPSECRSIKDLMQVIQIATEK